MCICVYKWNLPNCCKAYNHKPHTINPTNPTEYTVFIVQP